MNDPIVTVFIPVYNGEIFLAASIDSVLAQSFNDFELLIIDDGSSDGSLQIIESYEDNRIRLLRNETNKGISFTRNRAIKEARGEFLAILDADDIALPNRLEKQLNFFQANPEIAGCGSHAMVIDSKGQATNEVFKFPVETDLVKTEFLFRNVFVNSSVMYRLDILKNSRGYYDGLCEDYEMAIQLNSKYKLTNIDEILVKYRKHNKNTSKVFSEKMSFAEKHVINCMHQQLGIELNPELITIHHNIMTGKKSCLYSIKDYEDLLLILKNANENRNIYSIECLNELSFVVFYNRLRIEKDRKALLHFFQTPLFHWKFVSFKMIRKMIKQSLWLEK